MDQSWWHPFLYCHTPIVMVLLYTLIPPTQNSNCYESVLHIPIGNLSHSYCYGFPFHSTIPTLTQSYWSGLHTKTLPCHTPIFMDKFFTHPFLSFWYWGRDTGVRVTAKEPVIFNLCLCYASLTIITYPSLSSQKAAYYIRIPRSTKSVLSYLDWQTCNYAHPTHPGNHA